MRTIYVCMCACLVLVVNRLSICLSHTAFFSMSSSTDTPRYHVSCGDLHSISRTTTANCQVGAVIVAAVVHVRSLSLSLSLSLSPSPPLFSVSVTHSLH